MIETRFLFRFTRSCTNEEPVNNMYQLFSHIGGSTVFADPPGSLIRWLTPVTLGEIGIDL